MPIKIKQLTLSIFLGFCISIAAPLLLFSLPFLFIPWLAVKATFLFIAIAKAAHAYHTTISPLFEQTELKLPKSLSALHKTINELRQQEAVQTKRPFGWKQVFSLPTLGIAIIAALCMVAAPALIFITGFYGILSKLESLRYNSTDSVRTKEGHAAGANMQPSLATESTKESAKPDQTIASSQDSDQGKNKTEPVNPEGNIHSNPMLKSDPSVLQLDTPDTKIISSELQSLKDSKLLESSLTAAL